MAQRPPGEGDGALTATGAPRDPEPTAAGSQALDAPTARRTDEPAPAGGVPMEAVPDAADDLFGVRRPLAERYAALLAGEGVLRGLLGPREPARIWTRHLLNCAVVADAVPAAERVVDVGSGAGLPGIVLALRRPDLRVDLVEPLQRRVDFLQDVVGHLELDRQVRVVRGRADDPEVMASVGAAGWVTARAVAPLDRLVRWCLPLLRPAGRLLLMKGATASDEVAQHRRALERSGVAGVEVIRLGAGQVDPEVTVVRVIAGSRPARVTTRKGKR